MEYETVEAAETAVSINWCMKTHCFCLMLDYLILKLGTFLVIGSGGYFK